MHIPPSVRPGQVQRLCDTYRKVAALLQLKCSTDEHRAHIDHYVRLCKVAEKQHVLVLTGKPVNRRVTCNTSFVHVNMSLRALFFRGRHHCFRFRQFFQEISSLHPVIEAL